MTPNDNQQYQRIAAAIDYIHRNISDQPQLNDIAAAVHLSPQHCQRLFSQWAGISPKKFTQYLTLAYAKQQLATPNSRIFATAMDLGLSSASRLYDLFVTIEAMTPGEYQNGGSTLTINYKITQSLFGMVIVATTAKGVCHLSFIDSEAAGISQLQSRFPKALLQRADDDHQSQALAIFDQDWHQPQRVRLHLQGSRFQLHVWQALLQIPAGRLRSYSQIGQLLGTPKAARAIGSAVAGNPIAVIIPCHRIIQASGHLGGYRWGGNRKQALIGWEAAQLSR